MADSDEEEVKEFPVSEQKLKWEDLNEDYESNSKQYEEISEIAKSNKDRIIDLRPYMIEELYTVNLKDKLTKVLEIFRKMHLRQLPVIDPKTGIVEGVITR